MSDIIEFNNPPSVAEFKEAFDELCMEFKGENLFMTSNPSRKMPAIFTILNDDFLVIKSIKILRDKNNFAAAIGISLTSDEKYYEIL